MKKLLLFLMLIPFLGFTQAVNEVDANGLKQGVWEKTFDNGNLRYKGQFKNNNPQGIFMYYYDSGELQAEKEFFHSGTAAATHIFYKNGKLKAAGLYVNELKDSTWHYFSVDSVLMMSEQYQKGKLNGVTKTYYYTGELYEIKNWTQGVENGSWIQYFINGATKMEILINHGR